MIEKLEKIVVGQTAGNFGEVSRSGIKFEAVDVLGYKPEQLADKLNEVIDKLNSLDTSWLKGAKGGNEYYLEPSKEAEHQQAVKDYTKSLGMTAADLTGATGKIVDQAIKEERERIIKRLDLVPWTETAKKRLYEIVGGGDES